MTFLAPAFKTMDQIDGLNFEPSEMLLDTIQQ